MAEVTQIKLRLGRTSSITGNVVVHLYSTADYDEDPSNSSSLSSSTVDISGWSVNNFTDKTFALDSAVEISESGYYAVVIDVSGITQSYRYLLHYQPANGWSASSGNPPYDGTEGDSFKYESEVWSSAIFEPYYLIVDDSPYTVHNQALTAGSSLQFSDVDGNRTKQAFRTYLIASGDNPPTKAANPTPTNNDTEVDFSSFGLSWNDGGGADTYNVYIGESGNLTLVSSGQSGISYTTTLNELETIFSASPINQKIYWRIDSTNDYGTTTGDEWNFDARPAKASNPTPADATEDITLDWTDFSWS